MHPRIHNEGDRYGRLVIKSSYQKKVKRRWYHLMKCDCGNEKMVAGGELKKGSISSCGCLRNEIHKTHGKASIPEYRIWASMIQRCTNPNSTGYGNYGGRGIFVCDRWKSFESFLEDMGARPSKNHTIDRINNDDGYMPENCQWENRVRQNRNTRIRKDNTSGCKGVSYCKSRRKYMAYVCQNGKHVYLGAFEEFEEAENARLKAEHTYYYATGAR